MARKGTRARRAEVRTYRGSVWGVLVLGDMLTVGLPFLGLAGLAIVGVPELGLAAAFLLLVGVVATATLPRLKIGPDGIEVRNRFRRHQFPLGAALKYRRYFLSSRGMEVPFLRSETRWVPVIAAHWLSKGGDALEDDLTSSTKVSYR